MRMNFIQGQLLHLCCTTNRMLYKCLNFDDQDEKTETYNASWTNLEFKDDKDWFTISKFTTISYFFQLSRDFLKKPYELPRTNKQTNMAQSIDQPLQDLWDRSHAS